MQRYTYKVVEVREKLLGGKMSGGKLEKLLNDHAADGWQLKAITSAEVPCATICPPCAPAPGPMSRI